ncbi:unnamed protein product [Paramecium octaurelia]|uniref:Uncharacterized protein n=1 Tax=Paramecium octaurelia TaxID=43137 RepID=A0A8S1YPA0_PAROT|nr:unnamed protein product [Paramecium octaurelia]
MSSLKYNCQPTNRHVTYFDSLAESNIVQTQYKPPYFLGYQHMYQDLSSNTIAIFYSQLIRLQSITKTVLNAYNLYCSAIIQLIQFANMLPTAPNLLLASMLQLALLIWMQLNGLTQEINAQHVSAHITYKMELCSRQHPTDKLNIVTSIQANQTYYCQICNNGFNMISRCQLNQVHHIFNITYPYTSQPSLTFYYVTVQSVEPTMTSLQSCRQYFTNCSNLTIILYFLHSTSNIGQLYTRYEQATLALRCWTNQSCIPCMFITDGTRTSCTNLTQNSSNCFLIPINSTHPYHLDVVNQYSSCLSFHKMQHLMYSALLVNPSMFQILVAQLSIQSLDNVVQSYVIFFSLNPQSFLKLPTYIQLFYQGYFWYELTLAHQLVMCQISQIQLYLYISHYIQYLMTGSVIQITPLILLIRIFQNTHLQLSTSPQDYLFVILGSLMKRSFVQFHLY